MSKIILYVISIMSIIGNASASTAKGVDIGGDTVFWILLTIGLTILFAMRGILKAVMFSPIICIALIISLIGLYILFSAIGIVLGIEDSINNSIQSTVNVLTNLKERIGL